MSSEKSAPPPGFVVDGSTSTSSSITSPPNTFAYPSVHASAPPAQELLTGANEDASGPAASHPVPPYPDAAPPPYQSAMSYPTAAPYGQPPMNGAYPPPPNPKPMTNTTGARGYPVQPPPQVMQQQPPMYYQQMPPPQNIHLHHSHSQPVQPVRAPATVIVHTTGVGGGPCSRCRIGVMQKRSDMCCVVCLVMLAIFTFPFGLVFLCCLPCAFTARCSNCGHTSSS